MTIDRRDAPIHPEHEGYDGLERLGLFDKLRRRAGADLITRAHVTDEIVADPLLTEALLATAGVHGRDRRMVADSAQPALERAARFVSLEWAAVANWRQQGRKTFVFAAPLVQLLMRTDFDVPRRYAQLPFSCVYYRWLDSGLTLRDDSDDTNQPLEGAYAFFERGVSKDGEPLTVLTAFVTSSIRNGIYFSFRWNDPEEPIRTADAAALGLPEAYLPIANLLLNSTLYLSSPEAETRNELSPRREIDAAAARTGNPKKLRRFDRERRKVTGVDYIYVGASIPAASVGERGKLMTHHWVRGHWKQQAHGTGRAERKLLWVKPYERGKDLAEQVAKKYKVT